MPPVSHSPCDIFILCGGFGRRLKNITKNLPKPMIKIGHGPFLLVLLKYLRSFGFKRFILGVGYKARVIMKYFSHYTNGFEILFSLEDRSLGTGGAVKKAKRLIKTRDFIVINGDTFSNCDYVSLLKFHRQKRALVTMVLKKKDDGKDYGEIDFESQSDRIRGFYEKDKKAKNCFINAGIYVFNKRIFALMPPRKVFSLERDFFPFLLDEAFLGFIHKDFFIDIGTPWRLKQAQKILPRLKIARKLCIR